MNEDACRELLWILRRLNLRINGLEMDSEGRGDDDCSELINTLGELLSTANAEPKAQQSTPEGT